MEDEGEGYGDGEKSRFDCVEAFCEVEAAAYRTVFILEVPHEHDRSKEGNVQTRGKRAVFSKFSKRRPQRTLSVLFFTQRKPTAVTRRNTTATRGRASGGCSSLQHKI